jgi:hypothetical protein
MIWFEAKVMNLRDTGFFCVPADRVREVIKPI